MGESANADTAINRYMSQSRCIILSSYPFGWGLLTTATRLIF